MIQAEKLSQTPDFQRTTPSAKNLVQALQAARTESLLHTPLGENEIPIYERHIGALMGRKLEEMRTEDPAQAGALEEFVRRVKGQA